MKSVIITHGNREIDVTHTSWMEIFAFEKFVKSRNTEVTLLSQTMIDETVLSRYDKIVVFNSGKCDSHLMQVLNKSNIEVYLVWQDPNWNIEFELNRPYQLITPFRKFKRLSSYYSVTKELDRYCPDYKLSQFSKHHYLPFGNMGLFDNYYENIQENFKIDNKSNTVYVGSHKPQRIDELSKLVNETLDIYGNFDNSSKCYLEYDLNKDLVKFKGKVPASTIVSILKQYQSVYYLPDRSMVDLDVSHRRQVESLDCDLKVSDHQNLRKHLSSICIKHGNSYQFSKDKLIRHYGEMTRSRVNHVLGLDSETLTISDVENLSKRFYYIDNITGGYVKVDPRSVEYLADEMKITCRYKIEFVASVVKNDNYVDIETEAFFNLPIMIDSFDNALPFDFNFVKIKTNDDLSTKDTMKIDSLVKRTVSQTVNEVVRRIKTNV